MDIEYIDIDLDNIDNAQREFNRRFLAGKLTSYAPITVGPAEDVCSELEGKTLEAYKQVSSRCCPDEYLGTMEVYKNGFNVFLRRNGVEHSVGIFRYRG